MTGFDPRAVELASGAMVALALAGLAALAWRHHRRRWSELAAALCAIAGLYGLFARPMLWRDVSPGTARLRTGGEAALRPAEEQASLETFALPAAWASAASGAGVRATEIPDVAWLHRHRRDIEALRVSGHGLLAAEWDGGPWRLEALPAPPVGRGFRDLRWQRDVTLGSDLVVRGVWSQCPACAGVRLAGAAGIEVSAGIEPGGPGDPAVSIESMITRQHDAAPADASFSLRGRPRAAGRFWRPSRLWTRQAPTCFRKTSTSS